MNPQPLFHGATVLGNKQCIRFVMTLQIHFLCLVKKLVKKISLVCVIFLNQKVFIIFLRFIIAKSNDMIFIFLKPL